MRARKLVLASSDKSFKWALQQLGLSTSEYTYAYCSTFLTNYRIGGVLFTTDQYEDSPEYDGMSSLMENRKFELRPLSSEIDRIAKERDERIKNMKNGKNNHRRY